MPERGESNVPEDDPDIPDQTELLRSFHPDFVAEVLGGGIRPSSRAFKEIADKITGVVAMSVYRADLLDQLGMEYEAIVESRPEHLIVKIPAAKFRELGLGIIAAVEPGSVGPAHCHVTGKLTSSRQNRLADAVVQGEGQWVKAPPSTNEVSGTESEAHET